MSRKLPHLLSTKTLDLDLLQRLFSRIEQLKRLRGVLPPHEKSLNGETVVNLFWESSTRTRVSFELAAVRLGANVINLQPKESSVSKGESLKDTVSTLRALGCRFFVVRHGASGEVARLAEGAGRGTYFINGGDGTNEHPSQAILDAYTIRERKKEFAGLRIAILGDILRSRVARSNMHLLTRLGASIVVSGPGDLMPESIEIPSVERVATAIQAVKDADVIMGLRLQRERGGVIFEMSDQQYMKEFGISEKLLKAAKPDAIVMHPGPINRGVEIETGVADGAQSVILRQVENGLFTRMAIFEGLRGEIG